MDNRPNTAETKSLILALAKETAPEAFTSTTDKIIDGVAAHMAKMYEQLGQFAESFQYLSPRMAANPSPIQYSIQDIRRNEDRVDALRYGLGHRSFLAPTKARLAERIKMELAKVIKEVT